MDGFGDGIGAVVPPAVTFLFVGRYGVVDYCLDTVFGEVGLELVALFGADWEDVEHVAVPVCNFGGYDGGVCDAVDVHAGYFFAAGVVGVEVF